jgi:hypothetical protein
MEQICLGCKDECKLDGPASMTGCVYEDGVYPKDADIWSSSMLMTGEASKLAKKAEIQKKYPDEWEQEEH